MSSNIKINRVCNYCNKDFIAKTTVTKYCSHKCASASYKKRAKEQKIVKSNNETIKIKQEPVEVLKAKDFLSVKELSLLLNCSNRTIYRLIENGTIQSYNLNKRLTRIKRTDIDKLFVFISKESNLPQPIQISKPQPKQEIKVFDLNDYYTIGEVIAKFKVAEATLRRIIKRNNINKIRKGKFVYVSKELINKALV